MNPITQLQLFMVNYLLGDPALANYPIAKYKDQVVADIAAEAVTVWTERVPGTRGIAIQVRMPAIRAKSPNLPGPQEQIELTIRVFEDPMNNNTGATCESVGDHILQVVDGWPYYNCMLAPDQRGPALKPDYSYPDRFTYDVVFVAELPRDQTPRVVAPVVVDNGNATFSITCADNQATIYYTIDGTFPIIGTSPVFAAPVPFAAPTKVITFAARAMYFPSFPAYSLVT
jgi:hypothetical protein